MMPTIKKLMPEIVIDLKAYVADGGEEIDTNILNRTEVEIMNEIRSAAAEDIFNAVIEKFYDRWLDRKFHANDARNVGIDVETKYIEE